MVLSSLTNASCVQSESNMLWMLKDQFDMLLQKVRRSDTSVY